MNIFEYINQQIVLNNTTFVPSSDSIELICHTTGSSQTLTLDNIAVADGEIVTIYWGDGDSDACSGEGMRRHVYAVAGLYTIRITNYTALTKLYTDDYKISGVIGGWVLWEGLTYLNLLNTSIDGDIGNWILPSTLENLYLESTAVLGDISGWVLPAGLVNLIIDNTAVSGDIGSWVLPATLENLWISETPVSGDITSWVIPAALIRLYLFFTLVEGAPDMTSAVAIQSYLIANCGLAEADVDAILAGIYARRTSFTAAAPELEIDGTNDAPSGLYQDATPPTTGNEYKFKLQTDPDTEGFNVWDITAN